jgi:uncharacterized membrane protein (DUF106 family)
MPSINNNKDKMIQQLKDQIIELQQKYDKAINERDNKTIEEIDDEIYKLEREICKMAVKLYLII